MATAILPVRDLHPRYHNTCDHCDVAVSYAHGEPTFKCGGHRETAAGSFSYVLCAACMREVGKKRPAVRETAMRKAMIRHAAKYSSEYARFIANWYGVKFPKVTVADRRIVP